MSKKNTHEAKAARRAARPRSAQEAVLAGMAGRDIEAGIASGELENDVRGLAIYHRVYAREDFKQAAGKLIAMVRDAARKFPAAERILYLDIDGHSDRSGMYDRDMSSLLNSFIPQVLLPYLSKACLPSGDLGNSEPQRDDVYDAVLLADDSNPRAVMLGQGDDGWIWLPRDDEPVPDGIKRVATYTRDSSKSKYQAGDGAR